MKLAGFGPLHAVLAVIVLLGGLGLLVAAEAGEDATPPAADAEAPVAEASLFAGPSEAPMTPGTPPPSVEPPAAIEAGCHTEDCGNTGTLYGYGNSCNAAKADLDAEINDAADWICPGVVTGIVRHYGSCTSGWPIAECKYSGNADIECKICPGQACA